MTNDNQQFVDLLSSVPQDVAAYGSRLADYIEKHTSAIASDIRDAIDSATWIPESLRPPRNSNNIPFFARAPPPPQGIVEKSLAWISKNRNAVAIVVAFTGTSVYLIHRRKKAHARKRRAKKLPNGAKKEIVVLACSTFHDALTRSLAIDLERRGYVVYVTVSSTEDDSLIQQEAKADLRPLWIDLTSTVPNPSVDIHPNLEPIRDLLTKSTSSRPTSPTPSRRVQGSSMNNMTLAGIVIFPGSSGYPEGPLALLPPSEVVDTLNTRLVSPILTIQQFLPLLSNHSLDRKSPSSIVIAYPSIPHSLSSPRQIPESVISASLSSLASTLRREIHAARANITVSELKLGNFDMGSVLGGSPETRNHQYQYQQPSFNTRHLDPSNSALTTTTTQHNTHWHSSQRAAHQRHTLGQRGLIRGSSAREFHNAVFDALAGPQTFKAFGRFEWSSMSHRRDVVFVGAGARLYDLVGKVVPGGLVLWMMGYRRRGDEESGTGMGTGGGGTGIGKATTASYAAAEYGGSKGSDAGVPLGGGSSAHVPTSASASASGWGFGSLESESGVWEKV